MKTLTLTNNQIASLIPIVVEMPKGAMIVGVIENNNYRVLNIGYTTSPESVTALIETVKDTEPF